MSDEDEEEEDDEPTRAIKVPIPVHEKAQEVKEEHYYQTLGEAVRHMCRDSRGYDV